MYDDGGQMRETHTKEGPLFRGGRGARTGEVPAQGWNAELLGEPQLPISPPPFLTMATTDGRGGILSSKSGQRVEGASKLASSPGCWTDTNRVVPSGVKTGPHNQAPVGQPRKCLVTARPAPSVSVAHTPSWTPKSGKPSVAIHSRPFGSNAMLSGLANQPLSLTAPPYLAFWAASLGSPACRNMSHANL